MAKVVVINGHPAPEQSTAGKEILKEFLNLFPEAKIRDLARLCTVNGFDVAKEQNALINADIIVMHFPFYWYSVPALLKKWIDDVLTHGFAYGSGGNALHGKSMLLSFTTGAAADEYDHGKTMNWPIEEFLPPLLQTANLCGLKNLDPVWSCSMMYIQGVSTEKDRENVLKAAKNHAIRLADEIKREYA